MGEGLSFLNVFENNKTEAIASGRELVKRKSRFD